MILSVFRGSEMSMFSEFALLPKGAWWTTAGDVAARDDRTASTLVGGGTRVMVGVVHVVVQWWHRDHRPVHYHGYTVPHRVHYRGYTAPHRVHYRVTTGSGTGQTPGGNHWGGHRKFSQILRNSAKTWHR